MGTTKKRNHYLPGAYLRGFCDGRPPKDAPTVAAPAAAAPKRKERRKLSAEARQRMAEAQQKRWAAVRAAKSEKGKAKVKAG